MTTSLYERIHHREIVSILGIVLFGVSVRSGMSLTVLVGTLLLGAGLREKRLETSPAEREHHTEIILMIAVLAFAATIAIGLSPRGIGPTSTALESLPAVVWGVLAIYVYASQGEPPRWRSWSVVVSAVVFTAVLGLLHIAATEGVGLDVLLLHKEAATAIQDGVNPYTNAVTVPDGAPTAEPGDVITGYVYPPITAVLYSLGEWTFSDPRYTSLVAWLTFLLVIGSAAVRRGGKAPLLVVLLMASLPGWPLVLRAAWTEPVSLALAALAFVYWNRARSSGGFLGLMLGSKQYFLVAAPLLVFFRDSTWLRRAIWTVGVIAVTLGAALVWDFRAFWSAAIEFHMSTAPRPDSLNLVGMFATLGVDIDLPSLLPIAVGVVASVVAVRRARTRAEFFFAMAFALAASFVFSSQAFPNYWFLVSGLCGIALLDVVSDPVAVEDEQSAKAVHGHGS